MDLDDPDGFTVDHDGNYHATVPERELALFTQLPYPPQVHLLRQFEALRDVAVRYHASLFHFGRYRRENHSGYELRKLLRVHADVVWLSSERNDRTVIVWRVGDVSAGSQDALVSECAQAVPLCAVADITFPSEFRTLLVGMTERC